MKVVTVIQARMGSSRLPGKVMMPILGKPLLYRMVERVRAAECVGTVVVAATTDREDDIIEEHCLEEGIICYRGHPTDLLDRHYQAALIFKADAVVKIPSDCPLIDPGVIDRVLRVFLNKPEAYDYVSNLHPATYPDGNDVEIMSMTAMKKALAEATNDYEREHTTPYFWDVSGRFKTANVTWETNLDFSMSHRWTIDYDKDYDFIKAVYQELYLGNPYFTINDILYLLEKRPDITEINSHYAGVNWYRHHIKQLNTISADQTVNV